MAELPKKLGVVGAGTMGAGIAQLGALAGVETHLHDPAPNALAGGLERTRAHLTKGAERGRWTRDDAAAATARLQPAEALEDLAGCDFVIEAAPEQLDLKRELFGQLSEICGPDTALATNTSSIPVTFLATAAARPANVVGMHFFNPAPLMRLVEVIPGVDTSDATVAAARALGEAMGKRVIRAADGPGFLVNRCGRPFYTEALRLLQERVATHEQIDRICRLGGGFRMGPFELMDMVGIDVGFEVAKSFNELSFGEPRWRPNPIQERMARAGRLGRKSGRGYYDYSSGEHRPPDPEPLEPGGGENRAVTITGSDPVAEGLARRGVAAGFEVLPERGEDVEVRALGLPSMLLCADRSLRAYGNPDAVGFHVMPPLDEARLVELTGERNEQVEAHWNRLGFHTEWVNDAPGLVLGRIVTQLVNEAMFAVGEGVGSPEDVDAGLELGLNHPRGAYGWGEAIGFDRVLAALDGIWAERRDERYRPAPRLVSSAG
ncbi:MAG TPA: 3-hydroxyacyl-CoA dehydrogenase NAD-binding domain-containing protein [Thermoleophilaceae bacterium]|nr:3-hydroxyacyl-CoA dehydrogenase NAD-binding domain-containing protein [Thermoleophilaceae bacterium]